MSVSEKKEITVAEARKLLMDKAEELDPLQRRVLEYTIRFAKLDSESAKEIVEELMKDRRLLGEESVSVDPQLKVLKVGTGGLVGKHPTQLDIRQKTGCSVVAVERGDALVMEFGPDFSFAAEDVIYVCGSSDATRSFLEMFPQN